MSAVLFTAGCSGSKNVYLKEGLQRNSLTNSFSVIALQPEWTPDATIGKVTPTQVNYHNLALESSFRKATINYVSVLNDELEAPAEELERKSFSKDELRVDLNILPESLQEQASDRYIYVLESYGFRVAEKQSAGSSYAGEEPQTYRVLVYQTEFYLYDKVNNEVVSWGVAADEAQIVDTPEYTHYLEAVQKVANTIIKSGPFKVNG
jgi:hypothetical protein